MASVASLGFSIISRYSGHGVTQARRDLAALRAQMATINDDLQRHTNLLGGIPSRWKAIGAAVASVAPALIPLSAQVLQIAGSFTAMSASVGVSLGAYALAVKNAIDTTNGMAKAGKALSSEQKEFIKQQDALNKAISHFGEGFRDDILKGVSLAMEGAARALGRIQPIVKAIVPEINRVAEAFNNWTKGDSLGNYVKLISASAAPAFRNLADAARMFLNVVGDGFRAFLPTGVQMTQTIKEGAAALKSWSDGGGFQRFLQYVRDNGPAIHAFWQAFRDALRNVFNILQEFSGGALNVLTDALRGLAAINPETFKAFANSLLLIKSPLLWLVLNCPPLRDAMISLISAMNPQIIYAVAAAFVALRVAFMFMNTALLTTPLGWLILGLTALGMAIVVIATKTTWFQTAWTYTWNFIKTVAGAIWTGLTTAWNATVNALIVAWQTVSGALVTAWNAVWNGISTAVRAIWTGLTTAWNAVVMGLSTAWTTVSTALVTAWNAVWNGLRTAAQAVWTALQVAWSAFVGALSTAWTTVSTALTTAWNAVWNALSTAARAVWTALQVAWSAFVGALSTAWTTVSAALSAAWNAVWNALSTAARAVWTALQTAWNAFLNAVQTTWNTISSALRTAWQAVWTALQTAATTVWNALRTAWQAFLTAVQTIWTTVSNALKAAWQAVWNAIKTAAEAVWNALKAAWQALGNAINSIWTTVSNALKAAWNAVWNAIKSTAQGIWDAIKGAWQAFGNAINSLWDKAGDTLKSAWNSVWNWLKDTAQKIWHGIGEVIEKAINGIIDIIKGIVGIWNKIAGAVGLDSLKIDTSGWGVKLNFAAGGIVDDMPHFSAGGTVNFSTGGGVLGGYAPGRDTVPAVLSKGEGVLVPEAVRGLGKNFVHWANSHFSNGRGGKRTQNHFAQGGMVAGGGVGGTGALGSTRAYHREDGRGWSFANGGVLFFADGGDGGDTSGNPSDGVVGPGGVITGGKSDTGQDNTDSPHAPGSGGLTGIDILDKGIGMVLGFIGRAAIEAAFKAVGGTLSAFGQAGDFGKMLKAGTEKLLKGAIDKLVALDDEKKKEYESFSVAGAKSVQAWAPLAAKALELAGLSPSQLPAFLALMAAESGGNPNAINNWDVNAKNGVPSQGLMQVIPPTFAAYHVAGTSNNILDPLANMAAAANYIKHRYGGNVPGSPYANGTPGATRGTHLVGEEGPELVNFAGGETVMPAKQTSSILSGMGTAPAMPMLPDVGSLIQQAMDSGGSEDVVAQINAIIAAAQQMNTEVKTAWTGVTSAAQTGQSTLNPVLAALIAQYGTNIPAALMAMATANTTQWTLMGTTTNAQWLAMQAAVITPAKTEMTTNVPAALLAMSTANTTQWTAMNANTTAQWTAMRDGAFLEANDHMATKMPEWGNQMNTGVSEAWSNMGEATATAWEGMKEGTRGPTNWIIENSYNNGLARLWNEVAAVIFEDGAKTLPSVATLAAGGPVRGSGGERADRVPAMLSRGEHVWTAREVHRAGGHHAVQAMRAGVMGRGVRGAHKGHQGCPPGFALGGWLAGAGNVSGGLSLPGLSDLKRGSLMDQAEPFLDALDAGVKGALGGSAYRKMGGSAGALSPSDWMRQYIKKDDELNKIGSGGPPWIPGVSDIHVTYGGVTVNQRTADMLDMAKSLGASFSMAQGSFSSGVAASAGTHDGGGVVDVVPAGDSNVGPLRAVGFAAWNRGAAYGSPSFAEHIHAVALGDPTVSPAAAAQIQSYLAGGNGLADGGPDNYSGGIPSADGVTPAGGGRNVDPKDLTQNVVSFDRGGLLQPGYTMAFNGTGKPEPVGHNLEPKGSHGGPITFEIHTHGSATAEDVVEGINNQVLPKLRQYLSKGTGSNG